MYTHFKAQNLDHSMVFQRWLKCLFKRELPLKNVCLIWDNLFANEAENPTGELICLDYMVLALILNIKDDLIRRDNNAMYEMLLKYPEILQFNQIINLSEKIKIVSQIIHLSKIMNLITQIMSNKQILKNPPK